MHRSILYLVLVAVPVALSLPAAASAQEGASPLHIGTGMVLDFGGELDRDMRPYRDFDDDLKATVGLRFHLDYDLGRHVSLGGFSRLSWWEGQDYFEDRNLLFDLGPRITGHYDWRDFRFYIAGMPGLTISKLNDDRDEFENPAAGFTMSIAPGMEYWFKPNVGVYVEFLGWVGHYFSHDYEVGSGDREFALNQVAFNFGMVFAP